MHEKYFRNNNLWNANGSASSTPTTKRIWLQSGKITMSGKDYNYSASIAHYANCIQNGWGMLFLQMYSMSYAPGVENEYGITGKGQVEESTKYLYRAFMKFFYVRDPVNDQGDKVVND